MNEIINDSSSPHTRSLITLSLSLSLSVGLFSNSLGKEYYVTIPSLIHVRVRVHVVSSILYSYHIISCHAGVGVTCTKSLSLSRFWGKMGGTASLSSISFPLTKMVEDSREREGCSLLVVKIYTCYASARIAARINEKTFKRVGWQHPVFCSFKTVIELIVSIVSTTTKGTLIFCSLFLTLSFHILYMYLT